MPSTSDSIPIIAAKILMNSGLLIVVTVFMLTLAYVTFSLEYFGATVLFAIVTAILAVSLYRRIQNEWVRAQFGEYTIDTDIV